MKKIAEDANRAEWNHLLPDGFRLKQEYETRFGTHYYCKERFLKSASRLYCLIERKAGNTAKTAYGSVKKTSNIDGTIICYPGIEAIFDAFDVLVDFIQLLETAERPSIHIAVPTFYQATQTLYKISNGAEFWRGEGKRMSQPSIYSRELCRILYEVMMSLSIEHPLLLLDAYLNPLFREMEFIPDMKKRSELRLKAEEFTRKLLRKSILKKPMPVEDAMQIDDEGPLVSKLESGTAAYSKRTKIGGRKRPFNLKDCTDSVQDEGGKLDEVSSYNLMKVNHSPAEKRELTKDNFAVIEFWYSRKNQYPHIFNVAARIYATPVSSASSERVFSTLKHVVDDKRARMSSNLIDDIIAIRSLHNYA